MAGPSIGVRLKKLEHRVAAACERSGRALSSVQVLAVSKKQTQHSVRAAVDCGQSDFAENYVQEAIEKVAAAADLKVRWHFIGRIQANKAKLLVGKFAAIHSVDRGEILQRLNQTCVVQKLTQNIFLQFNVAAEPSKGGVTELELTNLCAEALACSHLRVLGLMVMPPLRVNSAASRGDFAHARKVLKRLRESHSSSLTLHPLDQLSMGTSQDFEVAIEEGATWIRVGTDIFGPRESSATSELEEGT